jgi:hypothetical protein
MATRKPTTKKPTTKDAVDTEGNMPLRKSDAGETGADTEGNRIKLIRDSAVSSFRAARARTSSA